MRRPFQRNRFAALWAVLTALSLFVAPATSLGQWYCADGDVCEACDLAACPTVWRDDSRGESNLCACPEDAPNRECRSCCRYVRADRTLSAQRSNQPDTFEPWLPTVVLELPAGGRFAAPLSIPLQPPRTSQVRPDDPRGPPPFV
jgi:hypothetical protein